jgi:hypothetical protein
MGPHAWSGSFTSLARSAADGVVLRRGSAHSARRTQCCRREYASRLFASAPRHLRCWSTDHWEAIISPVHALTEMSCCQAMYCNPAPAKSFPFDPQNPHAPPPGYGKDSPRQDWNRRLALHPGHALRAVALIGRGRQE